jgi:hypothetical protein
MIDQPIETAPKDGSSLLLLARPWAHPEEPEGYSVVVGYWHESLARWKARNTDEDLFAIKWAPIQSGEDRA